MDAVVSVVDGSCTDCDGATASDCAAATCEAGFQTFSDGVGCSVQYDVDNPPMPEELKTGLNNILADVTLTLTGFGDFVIVTSGASANTEVAVTETGVVIVTFDCDGCSASSVSQENQTAINNDVICPGLFVKNSCADEYDFVWTDGSIVITATPVSDDGSDSGLEIIVAIVLAFVGVAVLLLILVVVCVYVPSCSSASPKTTPVAGSTAQVQMMEVGGAATRTRPTTPTPKAESGEER